MDLQFKNIRSLMIVLTPLIIPVSFLSSLKARIRRTENLSRTISTKWIQNHENSNAQLVDDIDRGDV